MTPDGREKLRGEIVSRHRSVHAFCRCHATLNRATVYMVLAGTYPGNAARQMERIRQALDGCNVEGQIFEAIKAVACSRCSVSGVCHRCDKLFLAQTKAALAVRRDYE